MENQRPNPETNKLSTDVMRWVLFWNILSFVTLLIITYLAVADVPLDWPRRLLPWPLSWPVRLACLAGSLVWGIWYWLFVVRYDLWMKRIHWKALSFIFANVLSIALSILHPAFFLMMFGLYSIAFGVMPRRYAVPVVASTPFFMVARLIYPDKFSLAGVLENSWLFGYGAAVIMLGLWMHALIKQGRERQRMIDQLQETRGELAQRERQAGILEERQRLASAIHDTLAQDLTSIVMHLEAAEQSLGGDPQAVQQHIDQARRTARDGLAEARSFVWALRPEMAQREPLPRALERITAGWSAESGIHAEFASVGETRLLPPPVEVTLLRAAQEGLTNVRKHARANRVNLTLTYMEDEVLLDVQDDGAGFDALRAYHADEHGGGYGLLSLRERARELGGSFQVESEPGQGTTLVIQLPLGLPGAGSEDTQSQTEAA
jgi:signal transduction histidine kinase